MGSTLNDPLQGSLTLQNVPLEYVPGESYALGILIEGKQFILPGTELVFGFQLTTFFEDEKQAGSLEAITPGLTTVQAGGVDFLTHKEPLPSGQVDFRWTAAAAGGGPVTLRVAANAANNDDKESGDAISTIEAVMEEKIVVFYFPQIGIGTTGLSTFHTDLIFVNTGAPTSLLTEIFMSSGEPHASSDRTFPGRSCGGGFDRAGALERGFDRAGTAGAGRDLAGLRASHNRTRSRWRGRLQFPA